MSVTFQNGRHQPQQRRQLADQLDRFDQILDGLADGLQTAITDAAREGTRCAVKEAIQEVLNDPTLRAVFQKLAQPIPAKPSAWAQVKATFARFKTGVARIVTPVVAPAVEQVRTVTRAAGQIGRALGITWQWRKVLAIGAGIGLVTMGVSYLSGHTAAAVLSGIGGAVTAVAVQAAVWVRKSLVKLRLA